MCDSQGVPFTRLQEAVCEVEQRHTPWNIQLEVATTVPLDIERLRTAARRACEAYPMAKVRRREGEYAWLVPEAPADVPIEVVDGADPDALRRRFYGDRFDLTTEPPLGLAVGRGGGPKGGDRLYVRASHLPMDGVGLVRVLEALLSAYRGEEPTPATIDGTPREVMERVRPDGPVGRLRLLSATAGRLGYLLDPPVSPRASAAGRDAGGWRFAHRHPGVELTGRLVAGRPDGVSVNDVLLAALHLAIDRFEGGGRPGRISLMMPMNVRPPEQFYDGVGMYTLFDSVDTRPVHRRSPGAALERVAGLTDRIKTTGREFGYLEWWHLVAAVAPPAVRRRLPGLLFGPGEALLDTAVLSNLGRLPPLPELPEGRLERPWFTPPCWPPTPLGVGAATVDGALHLGFRFERSVFDAEAAAAFADGYCEWLASMV